MRQRDFFDRWIKFTQAAADKEKIDKLKGFKTFFGLTLSRTVKKLTYKTHFDKWKSRVERLQTWDLYHHRLKKNILYWRDRACPDIKKALKKWKAMTVTSRIPAYQDKKEKKKVKKSKM